MNSEFQEEYAAQVFPDFAGSYADYFVGCCREILARNIVCKPFDVLVMFSLWNLYCLIPRRAG